MTPAGDQTLTRPIGLIEVPRDTRPVLHQRAGMGIAVHADPGHEATESGRSLRERVRLTAVDGDDGRQSVLHPPILAARPLPRNA